MLNIRDPIAMLYTQPTGTTTSDPDDLIVTSIVIRPPTDWTTNETVGTLQDSIHLSVDKTNGQPHDHTSYTILDLYVLNL